MTRPAILPRWKKGVRRGGLWNPAMLLTHIRREPDIFADGKPLDLALYRRMFTYARPYRRWVVLLLICTAARSIQLPVMVKIFNGVLNGPIVAGAWHGLIVGVLTYWLFGLFTQFTMYHRVHLAQLLGEGIVHDLRNDVFSQLQRLKMGFFHRMRLGRIISRITSDAEVVRQGVQEAVFVTIVAGGQIVTSLAMMVSADGGLFLVVLCGAPAYFLAYRYFRTKLTRAHRANQESFSRLTGTLAETVNGVRVTQAFVREDLNSALWQNLVESHATYNIHVAQAAAQFEPVLELTGALVVAAIFIVGGLRVLDPHTGATVAVLMLFYQLLDTVLGPLGAIGRNYAMAINAMAGAERVFRLVDTVPDFVDPPDAVILPPIVGRVEFHNLDFAYEPGKLVLRNINLTADPGQTVALVGATGSGKSSIINLISKFYLPTAGDLLIDGVDIRRLRSRELHRQMGIVLQNNFLFTGTVRDNIRLGRLDATDAEVREAARQLDCLEVFEALPQGLDTPVGERGSGLSSGERQLVCFARAMLANPRIMILDEATSAVDTLTELRLQSALATLLTGRTSFVVAHRLSTIRHADVVLVLEHGRIVERGSHDLLLASGGVYTRLYEEFIGATTAEVSLDSTPG